jgi:GNAT superfamily N-acetyltransferase
MDEFLEIFLKWKTGVDLPDCELPDGFSLRSYHHMDEENWFSIYRAADQHNRVYSSTFREYFGANTDELSQRQFYLCNNEGEAIGTATAWFNDDYHGERWGRVHWVAIKPEYQGRGLAKCLLAAVLHKLAACGHDKCYLRTYSMRDKAIQLYLGLGFEPHISNDADLKIWHKIAREIPHPELASYRK